MTRVYKDPKRRYCDPPRPAWTRKVFIPDAQFAINCLKYYRVMLAVVCENSPQPNDDVDLKDLLELMRWYGRHNFNKLLEVGSWPNALINELEDANNSLIVNHGASENETPCAIIRSIELSSRNGGGPSGKHIKLHSELSSSLHEFDAALGVALESQGLDIDAPFSTQISTLPLWNLFVKYYLKQKSWTKLDQAVQHLQCLLADVFPSKSSKATHKKARIVYGMPLVTSLKLFHPPNGPSVVFVGTTTEKWARGTWLARWYGRKQANNFCPQEIELYSAKCEEYRSALAHAEEESRPTARDAIKEVMLRTREARKCHDVRSREIALEFPDIQRKEACNRCRALLCHEFLPGDSNLANLRTLEELMDDDGFMKQFPPCTCAEYGSDASYQRFLTSEGIQILR